MEIAEQYDLIADEWTLEAEDKFMGVNSSPGVSYTLGISPYDPTNPDFCYFNVAPELVITNGFNGVVFKFKATSCFKVKNNDRVPSEEFFFDLVEKASYQFAKEFHFRKQGTNLIHRKIEKPLFENLKEQIQTCIDSWDSTIRRTSLN